jgi:hypothetical protein
MPCEGEKPQGGGGFSSILLSKKGVERVAAAWNFTEFWHQDSRHAHMVFSMVAGCCPTYRKCAHEYLGWTREKTSTERQFTHTHMYIFTVLEVVARHFFLRFSLKHGYA